MNSSARTPIVMIAALVAAPVAAQTTQSAQDTATAYGARLTTPGDPTKPLNSKRINNRIENRIQNRISLRVERYQVGAAADPLAGARQADTTAASAYQTASNASAQATASQAAQPQQQQTDPYAADLSAADPR